VDEELDQIIRQKRAEAAARERALDERQRFATAAIPEIDRAVERLLIRAEELGVSGADWRKAHDDRGWTIVRLFGDYWYVTVRRVWFRCSVREGWADACTASDHPFREIDSDLRWMRKSRDGAIEAVAEHLIALENAVASGELAIVQARHATVAAADLKVRSFAQRQGAIVVSRGEDGSWTVVKNRKILGGHRRWDIHLSPTGELSIPKPELRPEAYGTH